MSLGKICHQNTVVYNRDARLLSHEETFIRYDGMLGL